MEVIAINESILYQLQEISDINYLLIGMLLGILFVIIIFMIENFTRERLIKESVEFPEKFKIRQEEYNNSKRYGRN